MWCVECSKVAITHAPLPTTIQKTPSQAIDWSNFSIFEGKQKFYYGRSAKKKCIKLLESTAHLKTVRRLWFLTSDRLETWPILRNDTV